jgi:plasmid stabilization system protein ParE
MSVRKTDDFIADIERQFEWYALNANWEIAEHYLDAVEATVQLLEQHPQLGPRGGFNHPKLRD